MEPALQACAGPDWNRPISQETFLVELKKVAEYVAQLLNEQHVIVAHSENNFDGTGIKRLLCNKFELDKVCLINMPSLYVDLFASINFEYPTYGKSLITIYCKCRH